MMLHCCQTIVKNFGWEYTPICSKIPVPEIKNYYMIRAVWEALAVNFDRSSKFSLTPPAGNAMFSGDPGYNLAGNGGLLC